MNDALMSFNGVAISHNPAALLVKRRKKVYSKYMISGREKSGAVLGEAEIITGSGKLCGDNWRSDLNILMKMCAENKAAPLSMPYFGAFTAVLTELTIAAEPKPDHVSVNFEFRAAGGRIHPPLRGKPYCAARQGDRLWDIAYENGMDVNEIVRLNPHIRYIMWLEEGEKVRLY